MILLVQQLGRWKFHFFQCTDKFKEGLQGEVGVAGLSFCLVFLKTSLNYKNCG